MDNILLCSSHIPLVTSIHNTFIEKYMLSANGSYVKVYIYLSKCIQSGSEDISVSSLADKMENTENDVLRALKYWEKEGLLSITKDKNGYISGIEMMNPDKVSATGQEHHFGRRASDKKSSAGNTSAEKTVPVSKEQVQHSDIPVPDAIKEDKTSAFADKLSANENSTISDDNVVSDTFTSIVESMVDDISDNIASIEAIETDEFSNTSISVSESNDAATISATSESESYKAVIDQFSDQKSQSKNVSITLEQAEKLADDNDFKWLCSILETYLGRPIKSKELELVSYIYDVLGFSKELILHLYDYCLSLGKTNCSYIQSVAFSWSSQGIKTPAQAVTASEAYNNINTSILKAFGLNRSLLPAEKKFVDKWTTVLKMNISVIVEACDRTVLNIGKADFKYADGILDNWHRDGILTVDDIKNADETFARNKQAFQTKAKKSSPQKPTNQFTSFQQRNMSAEDMAALEKKLLHV